MQIESNDFFHFWPDSSAFDVDEKPGERKTLPRDGIQKKVADISSGMLVDNPIECWPVCPNDPINFLNDGCRARFYVISNRLLI